MPAIMATRLLALPAPAMRPAIRGVFILGFWFVFSALLALGASSAVPDVCLKG